MKKLIASVTLIAALGGGAFALSTVMPAGAQTGTSTSSAGGPRAKAKAALDQLVTDGTITQAQEDAVISALQGALGGDGHGHPRLHKLLGAVVQTSADTIGIPVDDLKAQLKAGKSIAEVAGEHQVSVDTVKQALVDAGTTKVNEAVGNGKLSQQRADAIIAKLPAMADKVVNHHKGDKGAGS
jgi:hypothetical protein